MSSVSILTPIIIASWPAVASAVVSAAASMGFTVLAANQEFEHSPGVDSVESEIANSEVLAETLSKGEKLRISRGGVIVDIGVDGRGKCSVCVSGRGKTKAELRRIGEEVSGRIVQRFAYHKLVTELKSRGYRIAEESVQKDQSIQMRVQLGR
ncbi:MAG TPA: DUF1257 domain-containing protein [Candidatus Bathyarchaeia archaeon]|nr:DUF1257 domain-containing protein [Candidatus Bathyarchaeia archaeon]